MIKALEKLKITVFLPNMIKALKKLKIWSRKKKRRKSSIFQPPPSPHCCACRVPPQPQPTAPPLPYWLDSDHQQALASGSVPVSTFPAQHQSLDTASEIAPLYAPEPLPVATSYQQYLDPAPVFGVPVAPVNSTIGRRSGGLFGCLISVGTCLIRCFCPCIQLHEESALSRLS